MNEAAHGDFWDREGAEAFLRQVGTMAEDALPLARAALVLAAPDRPRADMQRYHRHLDALGREVGEAAVLSPRHYAPVSDRAVLLRLLNNLKLRHPENRRPEKALTMVEGMMLFAPDHAALWHEAGLINAQLGNLRAAVADLERFLALAGEAGDRHQAAVLLQRLRAHLN